MKKITVIVPVFNEIEYIEECLNRVYKTEYDKQVIVVDNRSTDGTREKLLELRDKMGFLLLFQDEMQGKGVAVKTAQSHISGDAVIIQDGDLEYDPNDYKKVLEPILRGQERIVYGSRNLDKNTKRGNFVFYWGGRMISLIASILYGTRLTDINTCYKGFDAELFKSIQLTDSKFDFCEEITAKCLMRGEKIKEVPISYYPRKVIEGKKLKFRDGFRSIRTLVKYRFSKN